MNQILLKQFLKLLSIISWTLREEKGSGAFFTYPAGFRSPSKGQFWVKNGDFGNPVRPETIEPRMVRRERQHYPYMKMKRNRWRQKNAA